MSYFDDARDELLDAVDPEVEGHTITGEGEDWDAYRAGVRDAIALATGNTTIDQIVERRAGTDPERWRA